MSQNLRKLKLKKNLIREFPREIGGLTALEVRDREERGWLADLLCPGERVVEEWAVKWLIPRQELLIGDNQFINLPRTIGQLKRLCVLRAAENAFIYLPPELGDLPSLRELDLSFNQIETLPREFGKLSALQTALLGENSLLRLPREIGAMAGLTELNVFNNKVCPWPSCSLSSHPRARQGKRVLTA